MFAMMFGRTRVGQPKLTDMLCASRRPSATLRIPPITEGQCLDEELGENVAPLGVQILCDETNLIDSSRLVASDLSGSIACG